MKFLAYFLAFLLILSNTTDAEAANSNKIFVNTEKEIEFFYSAGGLWKLQGIDSIDYAYSESAEFILVNAKTRIKNLNTSKKKKETCLLSFIRHNTEFHSINCF